MKKMQRLCAFLLCLVMLCGNINFAFAASLAITKQPVSVSVADGETAKVSVTASGSGLKYAWYIKDKTSSGFSKSSITTSSYSVAMNSTRNGRQLYCVVTDSSGSTVKSNTVTLSMKSASSTPALAITKQPSNVTVADGAVAKVSITATGSGLKYAWYIKDKTATKFGKTSNTTNTYSVAMSAARDGRQLYCIVTDSTGKTVQSKTVTMTMGSASSGPALAITKQPSSVTAADGESISVSVTATGSGLTYQWYIKNPGATKFAKSSITSNTYTAVMNAERSGRQMYCIVTDSSGKTVQSNTVSMTMSGASAPALAITKQPSSVTAADGESISISVTATGSGLTYQWYIKNPGATKFAKSSITSNTYTAVMNAERSGRQMYCIVTDSSGKTVQSNTVSMTMSGASAPALAITRQPSSVTAADGESISVSVTATGSGLTYQWYIKNPGATKFAKSSITSNTYTAVMNAERSGRQLYCIVTDSSGKTVQSNTVSMTMSGASAPALAITKQPANVTVDEGAVARVSVTATGSGLTYAWYIKDKTSSGFSKTSTTASSYAVSMTAARSGRQVYCIVTDSSGKTVKSNTVTMSMTPAPALAITKQPANVTVDEGAVARVSITATGGGLTYAWYIKDKTSSGFSKTSTTTSSYAVSMTEARSGRQVYCIVTDSSGKTVKSNTVTISMKGELAITKQPESAYVPLGIMHYFTVEATGSDLSYAWYIKNKTATKFGKVSCEKNSYPVVMDDSTDGRQIYCVVTDGKGNTVKSNTVTYTMDRDTVFAITKQPVSVTVAEGALATVSVEATGYELTYTWYIKDKGATKFSKSSITTNTYSVAMNEARDGRQVYCVVKQSDILMPNYDGTIASDTVTLSMLPPLTITTQPEDGYAAAGSSVTVKVAATGDGLTYEWFAAAKDAATFESTGVTSAEYTTVMTAEMVGTRLYCRVTDSTGKTENSNTVMLGLYTEPAIITQPKKEDARVPAGEKLKLFVEATGSALKYEWFYVANNYDGTIRLTTTRVTTPEFDLEMTSDMSDKKVCCVITDALGKTLTSDTVTIKEKWSLQILKQPEKYIYTPVTWSLTIDHFYNENNPYDIVVAPWNVETWYKWYAAPEGSNEFVYIDPNDELQFEAGYDRYYFELYNEYGETLRSNIYTLVYKKPCSITKDISDVSVKENATVTFTIEAEGEELTYQWYYQDKADYSATKCGDGTNTFTMQVTAAMDGRRVWCVVSDKYFHSAQSSEATVHLQTPPQIISQPEDVLAADGQSVTLSVETLGYVTGYEWFVLEQGEEEYVSTGETGYKYTFAMTEALDGAKLFCRVYSGDESIDSEVVTLTLRKALKIVKQPEDACAVNGNTASTTVEADGNGLRYEWYAAPAGSSAFTGTGVTEATYNVTMDDAAEGLQAYCIVTDQFGQSLQTDTVTFTLIPPVEIVKQPEGATVDDGEIASTFVYAAGTGLTYRWYYADGDSEEFVPSGVTTASYSITLSNDGVNLRRVYCLITNQDGGSVRTDTAVLKVKQYAAILVQPANIYAENGDESTITFEAAGDDLKYEWFAAAKDSDVFESTGVTTASYPVTMSEAVNGMQLYCAVTDAYGTTARTDTVTLVMCTPLAIVQQPQPALTPLGELSSLFVYATGEGLTYQWYYADKGETEFTKAASTTAVYSVEMTLEADGRRVYCVVGDKYGVTLQSETVTLTAKLPITITRQPEDVVVQRNSSDVAEYATFSVEAEGEGLTYQWYHNRNGEMKPAEGETSNELLLQVPYYAGKYQVYCVITDANGFQLTTDTANLTAAEWVSLKQNFGYYSSGYYALQNGKSAELSVTPYYYDETTGSDVEILTGLTFEWYRAEKGSKTFVKTGDTGRSLTVVMDSAQDGARYYCVVTDEYGFTEQSNPVEFVEVDSAAESGYEYRIVDVQSPALHSYGDFLITAYHGNASDVLVIPKTLAGQEVDGLDGFSCPSAVKTLDLSNIRRVAYSSLGENVENLILPDEGIWIWESFNGAKSLESLTIPGNSDFIASFQNCPALKKIVIKGDVSGKFTNPALTTVIFEEGVTNIGYDMFWDCDALTDVTIPNTVKTIYGSAFYDCDALVSIDLPDSVVSIGDRAFYDCDALVSVDFSDSLVSIGDCAFCNCTALVSVELPDSLLSIGEDAFYAYSDYELESITIPGSVISIGDGAIPYYCEAFVEEGSYAHQWCMENHSRYTVITPDRTADGYLYRIDGDEVIILGYAGSGTKLNIPSTIENLPVTAISASAFYGLEEITGIIIPAGVTTIGELAFAGCTGLERITVESGNASYASAGGVLYNKNMTRLICYPSAKADYSFTVPEGVTEIAQQAFANNSSLGQLALAQSVITIGEKAFLNCTGLGEITIWEAAENLPENMMEGCNKSTVLFKVMSWSDAYFFALNNDWDYEVMSITADGWEYFMTSDGKVKILAYHGKDTQLTVPASINGKPVYAISLGFDFEGDWDLGDKITSVTLPESITEISDYAFYDCSVLTSINIPDGVTDIGDSAFYNCSSLKELNIPDGVTYIGDSAFYNCSSLKELNIPESVTYIGDYAFYGCKCLTSYYIPADMYYEYDFPFVGLESLTAVYVDPAHEDYTSVDGVLFNKDKSELLFYPPAKANTSYAIPEGVTMTGEVAFVNCNNLTSISIPSTLTYIGGYYGIQGNAFVCGNLTEFVVHKNNPSYTTVDGVLFSKDKKTLEHFPGGITGTYNVPEGTEYMSFYGASNLLTVNVPASVTHMGWDNAPYVSAIHVDEGNADYSSLDGVVYSKDGKELLYFPGARTGTFRVPDGVERFGDYGGISFPEITSLILPDSIGDNFSIGYSSKLENITLPATCTSIGSWSFYSVRNLKTINFPSSVGYIGEDNLFYESVVDLVITVEKNSYAHRWCMEHDYQFVVTDTEGLPEGLLYERTYEGEEYNSPFTLAITGYTGTADYLEIPEKIGGMTVKVIGYDAFYYPGTLTSIYLPSSIIRIEEDAFPASGITLIAEEGSYAYNWFVENGYYPVAADAYLYTVSDGEVTITSYTASEENIIIPETLDGMPVTAIGKNAFSAHSTLKNIYIPDCITSIDDSAFPSHAFTPVLKRNSCAYEWFEGKGYILAVEDDYKYAVGSDYEYNCLVEYTGNSTEIALPFAAEGRRLSYPAYEMFRNNTTLKKLVFPDTYTFINQRICSGCTALESVVLPEGITVIEKSDFYDCTSLKEITLPESVTTIESWAFGYCSSLDSLVIPAGVTSIDETAFPLYTTLLVYPDSYALQWCIDNDQPYEIIQ